MWLEDRKAAMSMRRFIGSPWDCPALLLAGWPARPTKFNPSQATAGPALPRRQLRRCHDFLETDAADRHTRTAAIGARVKSAHHGPPPEQTRTPLNARKSPTHYRRRRPRDRTSSDLKPVDTRRTRQPRTTGNHSIQLRNINFDREGNRTLRNFPSASAGPARARSKATATVVLPRDRRETPAGLFANLRGLWRKAVASLGPAETMGAAAGPRPARENASARPGDRHERRSDAIERRCPTMTAERMARNSRER